MRGRAIVAMLVASACAQPTPCHHAPRIRACENGTECAYDADCASGRCDARTCIATCEGAADCPAGTLCLLDGAPAARRQCTNACPSSFEYVGTHDGLSCVDGTVVACGALAGPSDACDGCGCPDPATPRCVRDDGSACVGAERCHCAPFVAVGDACASHDDCASGNCRVWSPSPTCELAAGATCDPAASDCASCESYGAVEAPRCRQTCVTDAECDSGEVCLARASSERACYVDCSTAPSACTALERCLDLRTPDGARICVPL